MSRALADGATRRRRRRGASLLELMVVVSIAGAFAAMTFPTLRRAVEQARADRAAAVLRSIWAAQRFYHLDNGRFADGLATLRDAGLVEGWVVDASDPYSYAVTAPVDGSRFVATATRSANSAWSGELSLTHTPAAAQSPPVDWSLEAGLVAGTILEYHDPARAIQPGFRFEREEP